MRYDTLYSLITGYHPIWQADGYCDDVNNFRACFFDGGDCCGSNVNTNYCTECFCLEVGGDCNQGLIGDGYCNDINNNLDCIYDGGDCCLIVRINLTNELLNAGYEYINGDYEISIMPNGQTSWINGGYAIWHNSGYWLIGDLSDIGEFVGFIYAINDFYGLTDDKNEWHYEDGSSWTSPTDPTNIQIICVNE